MFLVAGLATMTGRGGRGGKRALLSGAAGVRREVPPVAVPGSAAIAPSDEDQRANDEVPAVTSSTAVASNANDAAVFPVGASSVNGGAPGSVGVEMPPMVEFTAPPPPPLFEAPLFPFSPSMAAAAGAPPPMSLPGMAGMALPGFGPYGSQQPHMPHPHMLMPPAMMPMLPAGAMGQPAANSFFATAMEANAEYGSQALLGGQADEPTFNPSYVSSAYAVEAPAMAPSVLSSAVARAAFSQPPTAPMGCSPTAGPRPTVVTSAHLPTLARPMTTALAVTQVAPTAPTVPMSPSVSLPATPARAVTPAAMTAPTVTTAPTPSTAPSSEVAITPRTALSLVAAAPPTTPSHVEAALSTNPSPVGARGSQLTSPITPARGDTFVLARPTTPPALRRAGRRAGPRRPRIVPAPASVLQHTPSRVAPLSRPSAGGTPPTAPAGRLAVLGPPPAAPVSHAATPGEAVGVSPRPSIDARAIPPADVDGHGSDGVAFVAETVAVAAAEPSEHVVNHVATQADMNTLAKLITAATGLVSALSSEVKTMVQKVQTQGGSIERLGVAISEFKKRPRPTRRFVPAGVEEYSDHEELFSMFGYGGPILSDSAAYAAKPDVKLSEMKRGALMMLNVRARVKARSFAEVGAAVVTKDVIHHPDVDFQMILEETMDEHKMDEKDAYTYLRSWISGPEPRVKTAKQAAAEKKRAEAYKAKHGKEKRASSATDKRRAYQPMMQSISHMYEAIKRPVVAAWFAAVEQGELKMSPEEATEWLKDINPRKKPDEAAQPRFMASARGRPAMTVAMHAMYIHLGVSDRIRSPKHCGDVETAYGTSGHYALGLMFVRNALAQVASGQRRRSGVDNGWYDLWRAELEGLKPLLPNNTTPWNGLVFTDATDPRRFLFDDEAAPIVGKRIRGRLPPAPNGGGPAGGSSAAGGTSSVGGATAGGSHADVAGGAASSRDGSDSSELGVAAGSGSAAGQSAGGSSVGGVTGYGLGTTVDAVTTAGDGGPSEAGSAVGGTSAAEVSAVAAGSAAGGSVAGGSGAV